MKTEFHTPDDISGIDGAAAAGGGAPPLPAPDDPAFWDKVRDQFSLARDKAFFNTGTLGAMPKVVVEAVTAHLRACAADIADWDYRGDDWIAGYQPQAALREKVARLVNAGVKDVALTENVTAGISCLAAGLDFAPGDEVLTSDEEHEGGRSAWELLARRRGAVLRTVSPPKPIRDPDQVLELFVRAFTPRTRVLMVQHIVTGTGAILPVRELCAAARDRGVFTVVDGAQAVGHIPVDVGALGCDAYAGCFHKWILAPSGTGFLYVRPERIGGLWTAVAGRQWDNHEDDGFRLSNRGTNSLSLLRGLDAALDLHFGLGPDRVFARVKELGDRLRDGLRAVPGVRLYSPEEPAMCAGITVWNIEGFTSARLQDALWERGRLRPRASGEAWGVRQSTHIYNSPAEIDRTIAIARELAGHHHAAGP